MASPSDHAGIVALLDAAGLPTSDLGAGSVRFFVMADGPETIGAIGIEPFGETGLLRSFAVRSDRRRSGIGLQLLRAAEDAACDAGMRQLVLLTQTAAAFFARNGYATIDRSAAPAAVGGSAEFRSLCPASATCMTKSLTEVFR